MGQGDDPSALRALPAVHELADALDAPHALAVAAARQAIDERRDELKSGAGNETADLLARARELLDERERGSLRRALNASGVIVHTNLGRAPLAKAARDAVAQAAEGYSNLELDLAVPGRAIVVSRGQLVEIGGGFRIPEVIAQSGAQLIEVGTTNRTRLRDYERALTEAEVPVGAILRVHPSNFRALGFVEDVSVEELCGLGVPVIDDVGSGVLSDARGIPALADEPAVSRSVAAGAALVCCSGDKLLGGPQAGLITGQADAVSAAKAHPLARALRIDKLSLAALQATLIVYRDPESARKEIPVLAMLDIDEDTLRDRAAQLAQATGGEVVDAVAKVGGGALPLLELEGPAVALEGDAMAILAALRRADPPVIARIHEGRVLLDPRTLADDELMPVAAAACVALAER